MDQKRTLWIVGAVGLFLIVVVGFALIIYAPSKNATPNSAMKKGELLSSKTNSSNDIWSSTQDSDFIPVYPERTTEATPVQNGLPSDSMTLVTQNEETAAQNTATPASENANVATTQNVQNLTVISENTKVVTNGGQTIDLTGIINTTSQPTVVQNTNTTSSATSARPTSSYSSSSTPVASSTNRSTSVPSTKATPKVAPSTTTASSKAKATTPVSASVPRYWIQVSSYSSKKNAEEARNTLSGAKIPAEIFTFTDASGNLFYRVRVGPYSTKSEAEYNQTRIQSINKFASTKTYITDSSKKLASAK